MGRFALSDSHLSGSGVSVISTLEGKAPQALESSGTKKSSYACFLVALCFYALFLISTVAMPLLGFAVLEQHSLDPKNTCLKVKRFITGKDNPNVLVFGSSLMSAASVFADGDLNGRRWPSAPRPRVIFFYNYTKCEALQSDLARNGWSDKTSFANMSYPGMMISEQFKMFQSIVNSGKTPKLAILSVAPRDFYSNDVSMDVTQRPVYSLLSGAWSLAELRKKESVGVVLRRLGEDAKDEIRTYREMWTDQILFVDSVIKDAVEAPACTMRRWMNGELVPRLLDVFDAEEIGNELRDLEYYKYRYQPANEKMFAQELGYLHQFMQLARAHNVRVAVVDMPITTQNKALIPAVMQSRYKLALEQACAQNGAELIRPESSNYSVADFIDSVHMNARGGKKLFESLGSSIKPVRQ